MDNPSLETRPAFGSESRKERACREMIFAQSTRLPPLPMVRDLQQGLWSFPCVQFPLLEGKIKDVPKRLKVPGPVEWKQREVAAGAGQRRGGAAKGRG